MCPKTGPIQEQTWDSFEPSGSLLWSGGAPLDSGTFTFLFLFIIHLFLFYLFLMFAFHFSCTFTNGLLSHPLLSFFLSFKEYPQDYRRQCVHVTKNYRTPPMQIPRGADSPTLFPLSRKVRVFFWDRLRVLVGFPKGSHILELSDEVSYSRPSSSDCRPQLGEITTKGGQMGTYRTGAEHW